MNNKIVKSTLEHVANMKDLEFQGYHQFRNSEGEQYGSFEVYYQDEPCIVNDGQCDPGWYWWACFPGCLPDGEPLGPFPTAEGAYLDALEGNQDSGPESFNPEDLMGYPVVDTALEEGTRFERAFGDGNDIGG